eukprot:7498459-Pyramimonas_sp.AAC.1
MNPCARIHSAAWPTPAVRGRHLRGPPPSPADDLTEDDRAPRSRLARHAARCSRAGRSRTSNNQGTRRAGCEGRPPAAPSPPLRRRHRPDTWGTG